MESRPKYEYKPMPTSSIKCESIDSLEVNTGCRYCDYNDRRKRVKDMHEIYKRCALWMFCNIIKMINILAMVQQSDLHVVSWYKHHLFAF
jgi:hypothetical protein